MSFAAAQAAGELRFGVFPQLSARTLAETYQPLADHLGRGLGRPVALESAADFFTFHERTLAGEYELVLTAPHMAWLAWKEGGYRPLLVYREPARGFVVVRADSPLRRLSDLRGKSIVIPDANAVISLRLEKLLAAAGLKLGRELAVTEVGTHTNAALYVHDGQADAAIVGIFPMKRLPKEVRERLRILAETPPLPSHVFLVPPRTSAARERALAVAIAGFMANEAGRRFLEKTGMVGVRPLQRDELRAVADDALEFRRRFKARAAVGETAR